MSKILTLLFLFVVIASLNSLASLPPGTPGPVPVDGGVVLLVIAGAAYGYNKVSKKKKKEEA